MIYHFEYCIELDNFILSHAGINKNNINPFTDLRGMFPRINFQLSEIDFSHKIQIHGHILQTMGEIEKNVKLKSPRFSIDSGCYLNTEPYGFLTAINLDSSELYYQKNT